MAFLFTAGMTHSPFVQAQSDGVGGGGDTCRDEISKHREMLYQWIQSGDASDLDFNQCKTDVRNFAEYQKRMLGVLQSGKVVVTCYLDPARIQDPTAQKIASEQGVSYRAITLLNPKTGNAEPTACINYEDQAGVSHIDCNYDSIVNQKALEDPNYQLTHHEYASIAGVELRKVDSEPDFTISRQLSQYEGWVKVKKLGKKKSISSSIITTNVSVTKESTVGRYWEIGQINPTAMMLNMTLKAYAEKLWPYNQSDQQSIISDMEKAIAKESKKQAELLNEALKKAGLSGSVRVDDIELDYNINSNNECKEFEDKIRCWGSSSVSFSLKSTDPTVVFYLSGMSFNSISSRKVHNKCENWIQSQETQPGVVLADKLDWGMSGERVFARWFCDAVALKIRNR